MLLRWWLYRACQSSSRLAVRCTLPLKRPCGGLRQLWMPAAERSLAAVVQLEAPGPQLQMVTVQRVQQVHTAVRLCRLASGCACAIWFATSGPSLVQVWVSAWAWAWASGVHLPVSGRLHPHVAAGGSLRRVPLALAHYSSSKRQVDLACWLCLMTI